MFWLAHTRLVRCKSRARLQSARLAAVTRGGRRRRWGGLSSRTYAGEHRETRRTAARTTTFTRSGTAGRGLRKCLGRRRVPYQGGSRLVRAASTPPASASVAHLSATSAPLARRSAREKSGLQASLNKARRLSQRATNEDNLVGNGQAEETTNTRILLHPPP